MGWMVDNVSMLGERPLRQAGLIYDTYHIESNVYIKRTES